jgi:predicted amino acid dehydrogenase
MIQNTNLQLRNNLSSQLTNSMLPKDGGFGFLFHATDWQTLDFIFNNIEAEKSPAQNSELWNVKPFVNSFIEYNGTPIGINIVMPVPVDLWIGSPKGLRGFREKQFFPALELANDCNLKMVAMGASTPYVCNYGMLPRPLKNPSVTTGHAATAAALKKWAIHASKETGCDYEKIKLAIFGAAGRLGKAVSSYIGHSSPLPKEIILIDLSDKIMLLKAQAEEILRTTKRKDLKVSIYSFESNEQMPQFDGAILVSNNSVPFLTEDHLRKAKFWIDDSHPRAASIEAELKSRKDTLYVECYVRGPEGFSTNFPFRLPSKQDCYTCCAEGYLSWREGIDKDFIVGIPDVEKINLVDNLLDKYGFHLGPFSGKNGDLI